MHAAAERRCRRWANQPHPRQGRRNSTTRQTSRTCVHTLCQSPRASSPYPSRRSVADVAKGQRVSRGNQGKRLGTPRTSAIPNHRSRRCRAVNRHYCTWRWRQVAMTWSAALRVHGRADATVDYRQAVYVAEELRKHGGGGENDALVALNSHSLTVSAQRHLTWENFPCTINLEML